VRLVKRSSSPSHKKPRSPKFGERDNKDRAGTSAEEGNPLPDVVGASESTRSASATSPPIRTTYSPVRNGAKRGASASPKPPDSSSSAFTSPHPRPISAGREIRNPSKDSSDEMVDSLTNELKIRNEQNDLLMRKLAKKEKDLSESLKETEYLMTSESAARSEYEKLKEQINELEILVRRSRKKMTSKELNAFDADIEKRKSTAAMIEAAKARAVRGVLLPLCFFFYFLLPPSPALSTLCDNAIRGGFEPYRVSCLLLCCSAVLSYVHCQSMQNLTSAPSSS
jgi:hypothetical protein